uniref:Phytocyanin domain-containing protein n=1 Tax=Opuntia streptacantha TaxID=393608 RepID=A0A7C8ZG82_OPUST
MTRLHLLGFCGVLFYLICSCRGATYVVGDSNGWDISTDLDSWAKGKKFVVGDVLLFQYASYHSVCELAKEEFESCKTSNALKTSTTGNTTFSLTKPGDRYFSCGNRMHCLGGMKIQVHVEAKPPPTLPPTRAPEAAPGPGPAVSLPGTSKNGKPSLTSSAGFIKVAPPLLLFLLGVVGYFILGGSLR